MGAREFFKIRANGVRGSEILHLAKQHLDEATQHDRDLGRRWSALAGRTRDAIASFKSVEDAIRAAQTGHFGIENRKPAEWLSVNAPHIEQQLTVDFPHFADLLSKFSESDLSDPRSIAERSGARVSWPLYAWVRAIMRCTTHIEKIDSIVEIGGGTGGNARLWCDNPIAVPKRYVIVDLPETLFFSEVFLRWHFGNRVGYLGAEPSQAEILLVPVSRIDELRHRKIDLVFNKSSMAEMTADWVDFYMGWLDRSDTRHFYSFNYFGDPIDFMRQASNTWSPRPSEQWRADALILNAHRGAHSVAEMIFTRRDTPFDRDTGIRRFRDLMQRAATQQNYLELVDSVRELRDPQLALELAVKVFRTMRYYPCELFDLCLLGRPADTVTADAMLEQIAAVRRKGTESIY